MKPFLDIWGRELLAFGFGAGTMFLFLIFGLNPALLCTAWLVALVGWLVGRAFGESVQAIEKVNED